MQTETKLGIDFWHAVEFSRIGRTPTQHQPALHRGNPHYYLLTNVLVCNVTALQVLRFKYCASSTALQCCPAPAKGHPHDWDADPKVGDPPCLALASIHCNRPEPVPRSPCGNPATPEAGVFFGGSRMLPVLFTCNCVAANRRDRPLRAALSHLQQWCPFLPVGLTC
jgi:hypothetical protein